MKRDTQLFWCFVRREFVVYRESEYKIISPLIKQTVFYFVSKPCWGYFKRHSHLQMEYEINKMIKELVQEKREGPATLFVNKSTR